MMRASAIGMVVALLCGSSSADRWLWTDVEWVSFHPVVVVGQVAEGAREIIVTETIKGDVKPGRHRLNVEPQVRDRVKSGESRVWFLGWSKKGSVLSLLPPSSRHRDLAPYFAALASVAPIAAVESLLLAEPQSAMLVESCLQYARGGQSPYQHEERLLKEWSAAARAKVSVRFIEHPNASVRREALETYAHATEYRDVIRLRRGLEDPHEDVRVVAIRSLARARDEESIARVCAVSSSILESNSVYWVVDALEEWGDIRLVPAVIAHLQRGADRDDSPLAQDVPALRAQATLFKLTGYRFPCDVATSQSAWTDALKIQRKRDRDRFLERALPDPHPLKGRVDMNGLVASIELMNRSRRAILIAKEPASVEYAVVYGPAGRDGGGSEFDSPDPPKGKAGFRWLRPGESIAIRSTFESPHFRDPSREKLVVAFLHNGNEWGINAWLGTISIPIVR